MPPGHLALALHLVTRVVDAAVVLESSGRRGLVLVVRAQGLALVIVEATLRTRLWRVVPQWVEHTSKTRL